MGSRAMQGSKKILRRKGIGKTDRQTEGELQERDNEESRETGSERDSR